MIANRIILDYSQLGLDPAGDPAADGRPTDADGARAGAAGHRPAAT